jgi:nucleoside-diphosphate-sugar epimerase
MGSVLKNTDKPLVITSGTMLLPLDRLVNEKDAPDPASPAGYRIHSEQIANSMAANGVCISIVRLPPTVHGDGDRGFLSDLIRIARNKGLSAYVNDGQNRWPAVHRLDAARLFRLVLEKNIAGGIYHGVAEEGIPFIDIASAIAKRLDIPTAERLQQHFGYLGSIVAANNMVDASFTHNLLDWKPTNSGLLMDIQEGKYFV